MTVRRGVGLVLLGLLGACRPAMQIQFVNHGAEVQLDAVCGDARFDARLAAGATTTWQPTANACHLTLDAARPEAALAARHLAITVRCQHDHGCSFGLRGDPGSAQLPPGATVQLEVQGATVTRR